jgi:hypothetical protein
LRPVEEAAHATFPSWRPLVRLDWILITEELGFEAYQTLPDRLSDHLGVVATLGLRDAATLPAPDDAEVLPLAVASGWRRRVRRARG